MSIAVSMTPEFITELRKRLAEIRREKAESLIAGLAEDHADYRYRCGYIRALDQIGEEIDATIKAFMEG